MSKEIKVKVVSVEDVIRRVILDKALRDEFGSGNVVACVVDRETNKPTKVPNIIKVGEHNGNTMSAFDNIIKATHDKDAKVVVSKCNKPHEDSKSVVLTKLDKLQRSYKDFSDVVNISVPELHRLVDTYHKEDVGMSEPECDLADSIERHFTCGLTSGVTNFPIYTDCNNSEDVEFNVFKSLAHALKNIKADVTAKDCTIDFETDSTDDDVLNLIEAMKNSLTKDEKLFIRINESNFMICMKRVPSVPDAIMMQMELQETGVKYRNLLSNMKNALKISDQVTVVLKNGGLFMFRRKDFRKGIISKLEKSVGIATSINSPDFIKLVNDAKEIDIVVNDNITFKVTGCDVSE